MPELSMIARWLIIIGLVILALGGLLLLAAKLGIPLGKLPGDIQFQSKGITCLVPLASSIILSILLTILLNLVLRMLNK
jgi:hypothetical protein